MRSFFDRPGLLLTLAAIFWAGNFVLGRAIVGAIPPVTLACLRWTLATLIFLPFAWPHLRRDAAAIRKHWPMLLFLGAFGAGSFNTLSYLGLVWTEALNGLVLNAAGPMFIALTAWGLFGDRLRATQLAGLAAGFFGVLVIIAKGDLASLAAFTLNPGDILLIIGIITWSIYTAFLRKRPHISWQSFNICTYAVAALANVPLALIEHGLGHSMKANATTGAAIVYVAIFPSLLAYIFYNRGVELIGPARAGLYMFLVPGVRCVACGGVSRREASSLSRARLRVHHRGRRDRQQAAEREGCGGSRIVTSAQAWRLLRNRFPGSGLMEVSNVVEVDQKPVLADIDGKSAGFSQALVLRHEECAMLVEKLEKP